MRRSLVRFSNPIGKKAGVLSTSFSTTSGGGGGGGGGGRSRGRGEAPRFSFVNTTPGKPISEEDEEKNVDASRFQSNAGHGRGVIRPGDSFVHPIPSVPGVANAGAGSGHGRGRGGVVVGDKPAPPLPSALPIPSVPGGAGRGRGNAIPSQPDPQGPVIKKPAFMMRMEEEEKASGKSEPLPNFADRAEGKENQLRSGIMKVLTGVGRGKPAFPGEEETESPVEQENRHVRARQKAGATSDNVTPSKKLSPEAAVKNALNILSVGDKESMAETAGAGAGPGRGRGGRGFRGRGGRGRGRGRGRGEREEEEDDDDDDGLFLGNDADGEKLAQRLGTDNMNMLVESFEEMSETILPSPEQDAFIEAMHVNYAIECEPEYLMGDFESNPDIDEKPPMSLRDALEKAKPFLMAYENIRSEEEWEEAMKETMAQVPLMKEIVDYYAGPERITAKQQQEELERVANTLPQSAPDSVRRFTDRAVLSLQSNPGWGFDKKCQFMDKLVWEVQQHYK